MTENVRVARRESAGERCALCHDSLGVEPAICEGCGTETHPACRAGLGYCPTIGCAWGKKPGQLPQSVIATPVRPLFPDSPPIPRVDARARPPLASMLPMALGSGFAAFVALEMLSAGFFNARTMMPVLPLFEGVLPLAIIAHLFVTPTWAATRARGCDGAAGFVCLQTSIVGATLVTRGLDDWSTHECALALAVEPVVLAVGVVGALGWLRGPSRR